MLTSILVQLYFRKESIIFPTGHLGITDPVSKYLTPFGWDNHIYHQYLKIKNLLMRRSGIYWNGGVHYHCPMLEQLWRCKEYLFNPLETDSQEWLDGPGGISCNHFPHGEVRSTLNARDLLKVGQLILNEGNFGGDQLMSSESINEMAGHMKKYVSCRGFDGQEIIISKEKQEITVIQASSSSREKSYKDIHEIITTG